MKNSMDRILGSVNYGEQGERQGLIWQKPDGSWVMLADELAKQGKSSAQAEEAQADSEAVT